MGEGRSSSLIVSQPAFWELRVALAPQALAHPVRLFKGCPSVHRGFPI